MRLSRMPAATTPAEEARSTVGPSLAATAPASIRASLSAGVMPPSGPTTRTISPLSGRPTAGDRLGGLGVQHDRQGCCLHALYRSTRGPPARSPPGTTRAWTAWLPARRPNSTAACDLAARSPRQTATHLSAAHGNDDVGPDLGQQLDRELAAVALRDRLQHRDPRLGLRLGAPCDHSQLELAGPSGRHYALCERAGAVSDIGALTGSQATNRAGVPAFLAAQDDALAGQVGRRGDEDRRPQDRPARDRPARTGQPRAQRPLKASRSREKKPC